MCPAITPNFASLAGLKIGPGWMRGVKERVGGVKGCTHLVELLGPMATVAFQTMTVLRRGRPIDPDQPPALLNTCHAYAADSEVVAKRLVEVYAPSKVLANVRTAQLFLDKGASFDGTCTMLDPERTSRESLEPS